MNEVQRGVVMLLRSAVTGERLTLPEGFVIEGAEEIIAKHHIGVPVYAGAAQCGVAMDTPYMMKLFQHYCLQLMRSERQMQAVEALCRAFDEAGVDYMPLKGCNMKKLYPKPELRLMGDADILIRPEQYALIRPAVAALGFTEVQESDHELIWNSRDLHLELHKRLIPSYNQDYYAYFGDGWRLAKPISGTRYGMSPEDEYIYIFTHFAKHYRDGGIGLRHVLDLWVYRRACPELDEAYIRRELKNLQLEDFYLNICRLLETWFDNEPCDSVSDFITDFLFDSGSWGKYANHAISAAAKSARREGSAGKGRRAALLQALFPSAKVLSLRYPVLEKHPWLLPVMWPVRWAAALLFRRDNIRRQRMGRRAVTVESIETYQQALEYVGLDFRFE